MAQKNQPGYPLPSGALGGDEIVCQLVFLPDRSEYWQALLGAISYMATWRAWERDSDKRGKDAAANWREAFELTMECWRMTCLDDLQNNVAAILSLLRNQDPCCNENITYYDSTTYITIIVPFAGDPPDFYGETAVADWDEWSEHLCYQANLWVDELIRAASTIEVALSTGGLSIGVLAAVLAAIAFFVVGGVLALPVLMLVLFGLSVGVSSTVFSDAADDIEDARHTIYCAIINGCDVGQAVEDALSSGTAWDTLYQFIDYDSAIGILYEGGDGDTVFLPTETDDSCECLCHHVVGMDAGGAPFTMIYEHAAGAQFSFGKATTGPLITHQLCQVQFNYNGSDWCGPMKIIDTISVDDAIFFSRIITFDQDDNIITDYYDFDAGCDENIAQLVDDECAKIFFQRVSIPEGGCAVNESTITVTYHDA